MRIPRMMHELPGCLDIQGVRFVESNRADSFALTTALATTLSRG